PQGITFNLKTGQWSWVEPYATRIKSAFEMYSTGQHSIKQIAKLLGYQTDRTLYNHLRNPIWTGWRVYTHKRGSEKYPTRDGRQADRRKILRPTPLRVKIDIEPLISEQLFGQVQSTLQNQTREWKTHRSDVCRFEVVGLLRCACGQKMDSQARARGKAG